MKKILIFCAAALVLLGTASAKAHAATLSMVSDVNRANPGDIVTVNVRIGTENPTETVNATQGTIGFPANLLEVQRVDNKTSIFDIWPAPPTVNTSTGEIGFFGGSTNSFGGASLQVISIVFRVRAAGAATLSFRAAAVTSGDGSGANILSTSKSLVLAFGAASSTGALPLPVQITPPTVVATQVPQKPIVTIPLYPDSLKVYALASIFSASWQLPANVTAVAAVVNQDPNFLPAQPEGLFESKQFQALSDGKWYLHVRFKNQAGWGAVAHIAINVDTMPPLPFLIASPDGAFTSNEKPTISFSSGDATFGIDHYEILVDGNTPVVTTTTAYTLPQQLPGEHFVRVRAVDKGRNITVANLLLSILPTISPAHGILFADHTNIIVNGLANPGEAILLQLNTSKNNTPTGTPIFTGATTADVHGAWAFAIAKPLAEGSYIIQARSRSTSGALSMPIMTPEFAVSAEHAVMFLGLEVTQQWVYLFFDVVFSIVFIVAFFLGRARILRRKERTIIVERDILAIAGNIKKKAEKALALLGGEVIAPDQHADLLYTAKSIQEDAEKLDRYAADEVSDIQK